MKDKNIKWHEGNVSKKDREKLNQHRSMIIWFTGLSDSGKSTLATEIEKDLYQ